MGITQNPQRFHQALIVAGFLDLYGPYGRECERDSGIVLAGIELDLSRCTGIVSGDDAGAGAREREDQVSDPSRS